MEMPTVMGKEKDISDVAETVATPTNQRKTKGRYNLCPSLSSCIIVHSFQ